MFLGSWTYFFIPLPTALNVCIGTYVTMKHAKWSQPYLKVKTGNISSCNRSQTEVGKKILWNRLHKLLCAASRWHNWPRHVLEPNERTSFIRIEGVFCHRGFDMTKRSLSVLNMPQCVGLLAAWFWASAASEGSAISLHVVEV